MSVLTELHTDIGKAVENAEGWFQAIKDKLPAVAAAAQHYENSPIVQALESAVLPPAVEAEIAALITKASEEFAKAGASTTTPTATDTAAAEPTAS